MLTYRQKRLYARVVQVARAALIVSVAGATGAATAATSLSGILGCRSITDAATRLACFDRESAQIAAAISAPTTQTPMTPEEPLAQPPRERSASTGAVAPAATATVPAASPSMSTEPKASSSLDPQRTFGLSSAEVSAREEAAGKRPQAVASITAHIVRFSAAGAGSARVIFRLDNDQVWQQLLSVGDLNASPGDEVEISRGALGSYWLKDKATARGCKVRRLH
jgi:hypothetical protein